MNASPLPPESLELRAIQQRQQIHRTALELISKVDETKQKLTLSYHVRRHFLAAALLAGALSFVAGYFFATSWNRP
jgi:hypothetical protein